MSGSTPQCSLVSRMSGAPLDAIKITAAALMLADHINSALMEQPLLQVWRFGRIAFPLFCFALACHISRGMDIRAYMPRLLAVGILAQPFFAAAFPWSPREANILFTLAAASAAAGVLGRYSKSVQHAALGLGTVAIVGWPSLARTGVDFGLAGILFPAALTFVLAGSHAHALWLLILAFGLNAGAKRPGEEPMLLGMALDGLYACVGSLIVIGCAAALHGRPRFLPPYALYAFYPGHLLALAAWRGWN